MTYRSMVTEGGRVLCGGRSAGGGAGCLVSSGISEKRERRAPDRQWYLLCRRTRPGREEEKVYQELIERRAKRIPLQQITGEQGIYGPFLSGK